MCMEFVMYSITANTVIALVIPLFTPNKVEFTETGELKDGANPFESPVMQTIFTVLRCVLFLGLYVGFGGVLVAVFSFKPPAGVWEGEIPDVSPAVACPLFLLSDVPKIATSLHPLYCCCGTPSPPESPPESSQILKIGDVANLALSDRTESSAVRKSEFRNRRARS